MKEFIYTISWEEGKDRVGIQAKLFNHDLTEREIQLISAILHGKRAQIEKGSITTEPIYVNKLVKKKSKEAKR